MAKANTEKRPLKTEPTLRVTLSDEQKEVAKLFYEYDFNFVIGDFGSGKTLTACYLAISSFRKKQFDKIWITRPMLKNKLAALPGTLEEKMAPYIFPIIQNLNECQGRQDTEKLLASGELQIMPIEVAKGVTFIKSVVIVDEAQDIDYQDFRTILTRVGVGSKIIFCASQEQIDRSIGQNSCFYNFQKLKKSGLVGYSVLTANHRNPMLTDIINYLEKDKIKSEE